jgi:hypothetical protein
VANQELLSMQSTLGLTAGQLDKAYAALTEVSLAQLNGTSKPPITSDMAAMIEWQSEQKIKALESVLTPTQLTSYRQQQAAQVKATKDIYTKMGLSGAGAGSK